MDFPDYSGIFKPGSGFKDKYPEFDPWSKENTGTSGPDLSKSYESGFGSRFGQGMRMAGDALEKWGKNRDNNFGFYGGGIGGGGVQSSGDFTVIYPQQQQPYTIEGRKSPVGGILGAVGALAAPFTGGASLALGPIGSMFG
jgi:hypothetical protein